MDFQEVEKQLNDLPATFRRQGAPYTQYVDALSAAMTRLTMPADGQIAQGDFTKSVDGWLDTWGEIVGILRGNNSPNQTYKAQMQYAVTARGGPPLAIVAWVLAIFGLLIEIIENLPQVGYVLVFPATLTTAQIQQIIASIGYVRPAGVPFSIETSNLGTFLRTVNFISAPKITGAYLATGTTTIGLGLGPATNNSPPLIPTEYLTDPTLNPVPPT